MEKKQCKTFYATKRKTLKSSYKIIEYLKESYDLITQNETNKNQITSIWKYDDEQHMKTVRSHISKHVKMPNSLSPKEILYTGKVIIDPA